MRSALLTSDGAIVNLSADAPSLALATAQVPSLLAALPSTPATPPPSAPWALPGGGLGSTASGILLPLYEGLQVPTQVNYVAKGCPIYEPGEAVHGSSSVIAKYLRTAYLWDRVRVQGGAYGCSMSFDRLSGLGTFSSYRDPALDATLEAYVPRGATTHAEQPHTQSSHTHAEQPHTRSNHTRGATTRARAHCAAPVPVTACAVPSGVSPRGASAVCVCAAAAAAQVRSRGRAPSRAPALGHRALASDHRHHG